jgi:IPT/TIG domain
MSRLPLLARTCLSVAVLALAGSITVAAGGSASGQGSAIGHSVASRPFHRMLGVVVAGRVHRHPGKAVARGKAVAHAASELAGGPPVGASTINLTYHGGVVLHSNTTYAIYWVPPGTGVSATYESTINSFFADVAAASGSAADVYASDIQYSDNSGPIAYKSTFGGSYVDSSTPIPNDCSGEYAGTSIKVSACVTDADVEAEVSRAIAAAGWTPSPTSIFFLFTPSDVGSCFTGSNSCAYTYYCAYHSGFEDSQHRLVLYANQPYTDTSGVGAPGVCDSGQHPNSDLAADSTINVASHEHNETITDPLGTAWYDASGNEDGDKCAWNFGTPLGSTETGAYNQAIGGGHYYLQQEWSNASSGCVLGYKAPAPTIAGLTPGQGAAGATVTISGKNLTGASAVTFGGASASSFAVKSATQITATVPSAAATGKVSVTTPGGAAGSGTTFKVLPKISSVAPGSVTVGSEVTITGTSLSAATAVSFDGVKATSFTVRESGAITATVPVTATGSVTVRTPGGTAVSPVKLIILPSVASLAPASGAAGTTVTIRGSGLNGATAVAFGGVAAKFSLGSSTQLSAKVPVGAATGVVTVTTPAGSASSSTPFSVTP